MSKLSRAIGAAKLALHTKSPTILVVGGVVAMGAATVIACKKTLGLEEVLEPHMTELEKVTADSAEATTAKDMSPAMVAYGGLAVDLGRHYAIPASLFVGGALAVFKSHSILQQRNAALAVAFTTVKRTLDAYRARVVKEMGNEADQRFMTGAKDTIRNVNGYPQHVQERDWENADGDIYNRVFSNETSSRWQNDLGSNKHFISCQQRFAQQKLSSQGYIYLSEIYEALGLSQSDTSRVCGWQIQTLPDGTRNIPIVDFGLDKSIPDDWKYNQHKAVYLDFNCQGLIVGGKVQKILERA